LSPLFPDVPSLVVACVIIAIAQMIYATVGFGSGMFAVTALALVTTDLAGVVVTLFFLTIATEVWILLRDGRRGLGRLLAAVLPGAAVGTFIGAQVLARGSAPILERVLGLLVAGVGIYFLASDLRRERRTSCEAETDLAPLDDGAANGASTKASDAPSRAPSDVDPDLDLDTGARAEGEPRRAPAPSFVGASVVGLASGVLGGMFGMAAPPVIVWLRSRRLSKDAFRVTLVWYFFLTGLARGGSYLFEGMLTQREIVAALWLLPGALAGTAVGIVIHGRLSERLFERIVAMLLVVLGAILTAGAGK